MIKFKAPQPLTDMAIKELESEHVTPLGSKWKKDLEKSENPTGTEIKNQKFGKALQTQVEFTKAEMEFYELSDAVCNSYVKSGDSYFRVATRSRLRAVTLKDLLQVSLCCSVLQCVAVCSRVLQCVAVCCRVLPRVVVCCSVLQFFQQLFRRR